MIVGMLRVQLRVVVVQVCTATQRKRLVAARPAALI